MNLSRVGDTLIVGHHRNVGCQAIGNLLCELSRDHHGRFVLTVENTMNGGKLTISFPPQKAVPTICPTCDGSVVAVTLSNLPPKPSGASKENTIPEGQVMDERA